MPTNTDRILSYLPHTFLTDRRTVLYGVADTFGNELLLGQNSLAEILLSHWVDFADKGAESIDDLAELAKLYGLAPLREEDLKTFHGEPVPVTGGSGKRSHTAYRESFETVEEFREHLKHYVRTFLEGTVTVQGILRVTAEALGLRIADETEDLDRWWTRRRDDVVTVEPRADDVAAQLRFDRVLVRGLPERAAQVTGTVDLNGGIELTGPSILRLILDGADLGEIDLAQGLSLPARLSLDDIVKIINKSPRPQIAAEERGHLKLASPQVGALSSLEILGGANDVAPRLLGLAPRSFHGTAATGARMVGSVDLKDGVDLSGERFLRLEIDGKHVAEIDCAGSVAATTTLAEIRDAINQAFPTLAFAVADGDGKNLILRSPSRGLQSTISVQLPAAQNAAQRILGAPTAFSSGRNDQPARVTSSRDLRGGIDLSERANLRLRIDSGPSVTVNCAGVDPERTQRIEIAAAINEALKVEVANVTERSISLTSPTAGPSSAIVFETASVGDAVAEIFGVDSLVFAGTGPTKARLAAHPVLTKSGGVNPWAASIFSLAIDGGAPIEIDLRQAAKPFPHFERISVEDFVEDVESVSLDDIVEMINQLVKANVAATDGERLLLNSPTTGGASRLEINALEITRRRRFVTRAIVTDEATPAVFGFNFQEARGTSASAARLVGDRDLSQSVDLTKTRLLRLRIDEHPVEIDCAGPRPRATTLTELVTNINKALGQTATDLGDVASHDGKHLILASPSGGTDSAIALEPPRSALEKLLGIDPDSFQGVNESSVRFVGMVDLSSGIDLDPDAALKLGFDEHAPKEISLSGPAPNHRSILDITTQINVALGSGVAATDGKHVLLTSPGKGTDSKLVFAVPAGHDATTAIFGIQAPRNYQGDAAAPARITGVKPLSERLDLRGFRFLNLAVDAGAAQDVDCASKAANRESATLAEVVDSINSELKKAGLTKNVATHDGTHLILTSPSVGSRARLSVQPYAAGDAREVLLGGAEADAHGAPATPASVTGKATLLAPVNLARRSSIRLKVDNGSPREIDISGADPARTSLDEIVARINEVFPSLASATDDDHLKLTSPTPGETSRLSVLPLRYLEVSEYQPRLQYLKASEDQPPPEPLPLLEVRHGDDWLVLNDGAADTEADLRIRAPQGEVGATIVNSANGWSVRLFAVIEVGATAHLSHNPDGGLLAEITLSDGTTQTVHGSQIQVGPLGSQAWVPFDGEWSLVGEVGDAPALQLNNPQAPAIVLIRAQHPDDLVLISVIESDLAGSDPAPAADGGIVRLVGRVSTEKNGFLLVAQNGSPIALLKPGPNIKLNDETGHVVGVTGRLHDGNPPLMIVQTIARIFDVSVNRALSGSQPEHYLRVTIGGGNDDDSLVRRINAGDGNIRASTLIRAQELDKATILSLPRGQTTFRYLDCVGSRFDLARFDHARFPDGLCGERGVFDVSRFTHVPPEKVNAVFASEPIEDPPVQIDFRWETHQPGTFTVNLPADLLPRFGARFNDARFSQSKEEPGKSKDAPELFAGAVAEPPDDPSFLTNLITDHSSNFLKAAEVVGNVPLGWTAIRMPFRKPQFLSLGKPGQAARLYLFEEGLVDGFIKLEAKEEGAWGNEIAVTARPAGPAIYDVTVIYRGGRFENACSVVLGQPTAELTQVALQPGPIGVMQAKAAGVRAGVTRDRAEFQELRTNT